MATSTHVLDQAQPLLTRRFLMLTLAELAYFTADGMAIYALPLQVTGPIGSDELGAGVAFGAFAASALLLRPVTGRLSDTHGRLPLMAAGAGLSAIGLLLTTWAGSLAAVVALRLLLGVAEAAFFVAAFAAVVDLAPPARMGEALSYNSLGLYLGLAGGPLLGEALAGAGGLAAAWVGAALVAALALGALPAVGETRPAQPVDAETRRRLIHWPAVPVGAAFLCAVVAMGGFLAFAPLHAQAVGMASISLPVFAYGATVVACRLAFATLPDRHEPLRLGAAALAVIAAGSAVTALWQEPAGVMLGAVVAAVGVAFCTPAFFSAIFATAGPSQRGAASGTASAFLDLGLGAGPVVLGLVAGAEGIPMAFAVAAAAALAGGAWTLRLAANQPMQGIEGRSR